MDHNPADDSIAVKDGCAPNHIWRVDATGGHMMVTEPNTIGDIEWSADGSHLYYESVNGIRAFYPATGATAAVYPDHTMWSATPDGDRLVMASTNNNYSVHDFTIRADSPGCTQAQRVHYGNGETQMVFRIPARNGLYVTVENANCASDLHVLTKAGAYAGIDWAAP